MVITPRAILDRTAALQVTEEFRRKVNSLIPIDSKARARKVSTQTSAADAGAGFATGSTEIP